MTRPAIDRLTERQKQCLRLVFANLEIKEIAAELGLSPNTVKEHLRDARRLLRANRSMEAARMLVAHEADTFGMAPPKRVAPAAQANSSDGATEAPKAPPAVRKRYPLGILQRIGLIVAIAFVAVALAGALIIGADAINRFILGYGIDISEDPYSQ